MMARVAKRRPTFGFSLNLILLFCFIFVDSTAWILIETCGLKNEHFRQVPWRNPNNNNFKNQQIRFRHKSHTLMSLSRKSQDQKQQPVESRPLSNKKTKKKEDNDYLATLLRQHNYDRRLITLSSDDLPLLAELHDKGETHLCRIKKFLFENESNDDSLEATDGKKRKKKDPRVQVEMDGEDGFCQIQKIIDIGQLTTIWEEDPDWVVLSDDNELIKQRIDKFPIGYIEKALDGMYRSRVGQARSTSSGLTKKQVTKLALACPDSTDSEHAERILRQAVKTGSNFARLVDSSNAMECLYPSTKKSDSNNKRSRDDPRLRRAIGAYTLAQDARLGGRFKRMSCILVSHNDASGDVSLINGGWLVLDQSVRAGTEARKFASRDANSPQTAADQRIVYRLECLAMGQTFSSGSSDSEDGTKTNMLELDVRETLLAMGLSPTPDGAVEALIKLGIWSRPSMDQGRKVGQGRDTTVTPWPQSTLEAAKWYKQTDQNRRKQLYHTLHSDDSTIRDDMEGRIDLTSLPAVCIDATRTSFRDDAVSIRPRSSTGRKVVKDASKWEILIHIADVSDIYAPSYDGLATTEKSASKHLKMLREAAVSRGTSRYDLPLGPLHLMPPVALESLALQTVNPDFGNNNMAMLSSLTHKKETTNRCVTVWAYIDERSGRLMDAGLERTLVSCPLALSYRSASALLDGKGEIMNDSILGKTRAMLGVVERNLKLWSEYQKNRNEGARAREQRFAAREMVSEQVYKTNQPTGREGKGFQRTRGHRLVDNALELYGYSVGGLLRKSNAPVPRVSGNGAMRVATAPLRRYVDGMAQRQALAVLCEYGGPRLTKSECRSIGKEATEAINSIANIQSVSKQVSKIKTMDPMTQQQQREALQSLQAHMAGKRNTPVPAMSTGKQSEVVLLGIGALATCRGIHGTLKPGERVMVRIRNIDKKTGTISAVLVDEQRRIKTS